MKLYLEVLFRGTDKETKRDFSFNRFYLVTTHNYISIPLYDYMKRPGTQRKIDLFLQKCKKRLELSYENVSLIPIRLNQFNGDFKL